MSDQFKIIKSQLSITEYLSFIDFVSKMCFSKDKSTNQFTSYRPSYKNIGIKLAFLKYFTNREQTSIADNFDLISNFSIYDYENEVNISQIEDMLEIIDENINFMKLQILYDKPIYDKKSPSDIKSEADSIFQSIVKSKRPVPMPQDHKKKRNI